MIFTGKSVICFAIAAALIVYLAFQLTSFADAASDVRPKVLPQDLKNKISKEGENLVLIRTEFWSFHDTIGNVDKFTQYGYKFCDTITTSGHSPDYILMAKPGRGEVC